MRICKWENVGSRNKNPYTFITLISSNTMHPHILSSLLLLLLTHAVTASPVTTAIAKRQDVDCSDLAAPFSETCWEAIGAGDWLKTWNETTPRCTTENKTSCCYQKESWSTCFLRLERGNPGVDCTKINYQACTWSDSQQVRKQGEPGAAQAHYILRAIWGKYMTLSSLKSQALTRSCI